MKTLIRFLLLVFLGSLCLGSAFADLTTDNQAYYSFDENDVSGTTMIDLSGNGNGTCNMDSGCDTVPGLLINASDFDGTDDYIDTPELITDARNQVFSISTWVYFDTIGTNYETIYSEGNTGNDNLYTNLAIDTTGIMVFSFRNGAGTTMSYLGTTTLSTSGWYHIVLTKNGDTVPKLYINTIDDSMYQSQNQGATEPTENTFHLGNIQRTSSINHLDGKLDEFAFYNNKILNTTEISQLYNNGTGFNPYAAQPQITFQNISVNNESFINNSYFNTSSLDFEVQLNTIDTNNNTNQTYYLYNSTGLINTTQYATNNLTGLFSLNLSDGAYKINFFAENNETNASTGNYSFNIDTTPANVSVNAFTEWNNGYNVTDLNTTLNITCEDPNLVTCEIHWDDNTTTNILTTQYKLFTTNGNHTFTLEAHDSANNTVSANGTIFINPYQYFRFNNSITSAFVTGYDVITTNGTYSVSGEYLILPLYDLGLGTHQFNFTKQGYVNETFNVTFNTTSALNETFEVDPVTLTMKMFDIDSPTTQLTFNVTILNSTDSAVFNNQVNFSKQFDEIPTGDIEIIVESGNYSTAYFYQTLTPYTSINIIGYLIPLANSDVVTFNVVDQASELPLNDVLIEAQKLINGTYTTISQAETDSSGTTFMFLDITQAYKFIFTKDGYVSATANSIPGKTEYTVRLQEEGSTFTFIDGISYYLLPSQSVLYNGQNYTFKGFISGTGLTQVQYTLKDQNGTTIYALNSTNPTGTTFTYQLNNLNATQYTQITQTLKYFKDGNSNTVTKIYRTTAIGTESFIYYLKYDFAQSDTEDDSLFRWLVMIISIGGSFLLGKLIGANTLGQSIGVVAVSGFFTYIDWMPEVYFGAIAVASLIVFATGGITR